MFNFTAEDYAWFKTLGFEIVKNKRGYYTVIPYPYFSSILSHAKAEESAKEAGIVFNVYGFITSYKKTKNDNSN